MSRISRKIPLSVLLFAAWLMTVEAQVRWIDPLHADLGALRKNEEAVILFRYVNDGPGVLILDNVRTDCGCTVPEWREAPLLPGEEAAIRVQFRPQSRGRHHKKVRVWFSGARKPVILSIGARVR
jgi:hypothetical protein